MNTQPNTTTGEWTAAKLQYFDGTDHWFLSGCPSVHFDTEKDATTMAASHNAILAAERENEGAMIRKLSDLLSGGNAGTWDEICHSVQQLRSQLAATGDALKHLQRYGHLPQYAEETVNSARSQR